jgi:zinc-binding alcohol dehydrogenase family protein
MKAVGFFRYLPIAAPASLIDLEIEKPTPKARDILVEIKAISVNPVDTKVRAPKDKIEENAKILGFDASGIVVETGSDVTLFKKGDEVYYAGDITRQGSNAQFQIVDERIVGLKPKSLSFEQAAALPLTSITAYECLFDRMGIDFNGMDRGKSLLIIGGAGGVGSIAIQLAKLAGLHVIASASRPDTIKWVKGLGADEIVNHRQPMKAQIVELGHEYVDYIAIFNDTDGHWSDVAQMIKPQGHIVSIVESKNPLEMSLIRSKSVTLSWELMFTRSMFETDDMIKQHELLNEVASLIDAGKIHTTLEILMQPINAKNLKKAHELLESGKAKGKIVISGF